MPTITDIAICIRHWDFSETSQTVSLFGRGHGVIRGLAKGAKREKGRFSGGIDLFARGEVIAIAKSGSELATLTEWNLLDAHWFLRENLAAHRRALYFADLIHHMVRDHDPHLTLFDSLASALAGLGDPSTIEATTVRFLWSLLSETGYQPDVRSDCETGVPLPSGVSLAFQPRRGGITSKIEGLDQWRLRPETLEVLRHLAEQSSNEPGDGCGQVNTMTAEAARRAGCLLSAYLRTILGYEPATLRWVYPELAATD